MSEIVKLHNVTKHYGEREVLSSVNLRIDPGEVHGFLGPNGAGKSTTIKIILGLEKPREGTVELFGEGPVQFFKKQSSRLGVLPEKLPLYDEMVLEDYLSFVYELKNQKKLSKKYLFDVVEEFQLEDSQGRILKNLSRGNRQKVGLAQAFMGSPELVILDEPTLGLDPENIVTIRELITKFSKKSAIFLSSHLLSEVQRLCHKITIIDDGKIISSSRKEKLLNDFGIESTFFLKTKSILRPSEVQLLESRFNLKLLSHRGMFLEFSGNLDEEKRGQLFQFLAKLSSPVLDAHWKEKNIEEAYLSALGKSHEASFL